jgi:hypothetical protein
VAPQEFIRQDYIIGSRDDSGRRYDDLHTEFLFGPLPGCAATAGSSTSLPMSTASGLLSRIAALRAAGKVGS